MHGEFTNTINEKINSKLTSVLYIDLQGVKRINNDTVLPYNIWYEAFGSFNDYINHMDFELFNTEAKYIQDEMLMLDVNLIVMSNVSEACFMDIMKFINKNHRFTVKLFEENLIAYR